MKIKPVQLMESITMAIECGISHSEWLRLAPNHFAVLNGKRYSVKDIEKNYSELDPDILSGLEDWQLDGGKSVRKSGVLAAQMGGSETIKTKKFAPKKCVLIFRSTGIAAGRKDR